MEDDQCMKESDGGVDYWMIESLGLYEKHCNAGILSYLFHRDVENG